MIMDWFPRDRSGKIVLVLRASVGDVYPENQPVNGSKEGILHGL